jgi:hypothetical protein
MHRQILYLSHMSPQASYRHLSDITRQSSSLNCRVGIHAVLLFDGFRFCQRLLGPVEAMAALLLRLQRDPRHTGLRLLADELLDAGPADASGCARAWVSGYCDALEFDDFDVPAAPQGRAALQRFEAILARADLRP